MISINAVTRKITMHKGDTGSVTFQISGDALVATDRVLFTLKDAKGNIVKQEVITPTNGEFSVTFTNADTCEQKEGLYSYDIRVLGNPVITDGKVVSAASVDTPANAAQLELIGVVGDVPSPADEAEEG